MANKYRATEKLYDKDAYATTFDATILQVEPAKTGLCLILEKTLFFPEEGGQAQDKGTLTCKGVEYAVSYVALEKRDGVEVICHYIKEGAVGTDKDVLPLCVDAKVQGKIDWQDRYDKMQNHSGEHILSGIIHSEFGFDNVGFHLNDELFTMDFNGVISKEQLEFLEKRANEIVMENVAIYGEYIPDEELAVLEYRSKKEIEGAVRIVTIEGYDKCACCAPHVKSSIEVGVIKIVKAENWKGGMRLTVLCGNRAYRDYAKKHELLQNLSRSFSTSEDKITDVVEGLKNNLADLEFKMASLECQMATEKLLQNPIQFFETLSPKALTKAMDDAMRQKPSELFMTFVGNDESGYRYMVASATQNVEEVGKMLREKLGAKGGGRGTMVQGMVNATKEKIEEEICEYYI